MPETGWESLTPEEKKRRLYLNRKAVLDAFLERRAISPEQYEKSLGDEMAIICVVGLIYWCLDKKMGKRLACISACRTSFTRW